MPLFVRSHAQPQAAVVATRVPRPLVNYARTKNTRNWFSQKFVTPEGTLVQVRINRNPDVAPQGQPVMFYENSAQPIPVPGTRSYHDLPASGLTERIDWRSALGPVKVAAPLFALGSLPLIFRSEDDEY